MWNRVTQMISGTESPITTTFTYDGHGQRVKRLVNNGASTSTTHYAGERYKKRHGVVAKHYFSEG
jgi:YD repeat-containing protein